MSAATEADFARVAVRDDGSDDNGEPLCSEPSWHVGKLESMAPRAVSTPIRHLADRHHIQTEN
jgi:hypothetical protein